MFNKIYLWSVLLIGFLMLGLIGQPHKVFAITWSEEVKTDTREPSKEIGGPQRRFVLGPEDIIEISVWGNKEFAGDLPVRPDGNISIPLIGDVKVEGLTPDQVKVLVTQKLRKFITDASVTVFVKKN